MSGEWRVVTVAGVGLIGGSFALALRQAGFAGKIIGVSSPATVQAALERGAIDEASPLAEALSAHQSPPFLVESLMDKLAFFGPTLDDGDWRARPMVRIAGE